MTETDIAPAESPYATLQRLKDEYDQINEELEEIRTTLIAPREEQISAIMAEAEMIAKTIYLGSIRDPEGKLTLSPTYKTRRTTKIDIDKLRANHPEIYGRVRPYVTDNIAMDILEAANGSMDQVQALLRGINKDIYDAKAKVRVPDLERAINPPEREVLVSEGIIEDGIITVGEPWVCSAAFAAAVKSQKRGRKTKPAEIEEGEDDE